MSGAVPHTHLAQNFMLGANKGADGVGENEREANEQCCSPGAAQNALRAA